LRHVCIFNHIKISCDFFWGWLHVFLLWSIACWLYSLTLKRQLYFT
jgi:hypothetical protein